MTPARRNPPAPLRPGEGRAVLLSAAYFFLLLMGYYLLRPLRETFGISRGADALPLVWTCTLAAMAVVNPIYSAVAARLPRRRFIPLAYHAFAAMLAAFAALYALLPGHGGAALGYTFYVWLSVYNLFVVSIFWSLMSDLYGAGDGGRLFGVIAVGGTLGAMAGAWATAGLAGPLGQARFHWLFLASALLLEAAVLCAAALFRERGASGAAAASREPGPGAAAGLALLGRQRLLQSISLYMLLYAVAGTFLYVQQGRVVEAAFASAAERAAAFARIDLWANALTLAAQALLTHRLVARAGTAAALLALPLATLLGFGALWLWPGFTALAVFQVARRGLHYAVDRPVRETLYIPLSPDARYKAKSFIDTFVYRAGDFIGVWMAPALGALSVPLGLPAMGASALWLAGAVWLGRAHLEGGGRRRR
jgi:AAA family ATP:ADP antiporter